MSRWRIWVTLTVVAALMLGAYRLIGPVQPPPGAKLDDLQDVNQLPARFNAAKGTPRLILVLSPT